jgi:hypothetical protein
MNTKKMSLKAKIMTTMTILESDRVEAEDINIDNI